jgi:nitroreductase
MDIDVNSVDEALSTTRSVRFRLDLERPVDNDVLLDCIDVAEQAPSGGNQGSRRWVIIRDAAVKVKIAELYMATAGEWMIASRDAIAGSGHPQERVMASAAYLAEHLAEVPAIVIPTIIGEHDGSGLPGLFDSVIQSVWSFCVALRARGLGTAWTTAILRDREALAEVLSLPAGMTPIAMLPVAWTKGTDFKLAPRLPARQITYFDSFARTWESGPSDPPTFSDCPGAIVEVDIKAPTRAVWPFIADINFPANHSDEFVGARWAEGFDGPALGAKFVGTNHRADLGDWEVPCTIDHFEERRAFGWATRDVDNPTAQWRFELANITGASRLRFAMVLGPGPSRFKDRVEADPDNAPEIITSRVTAQIANMQRVVDAVKVAAEASAISE